MAIDVKVDGGYPCWIRLAIDGRECPSFKHTELLNLELAIKLAKRECLRLLPSRDWHEIDPEYAKQTP